MSFKIERIIEKNNISFSLRPHPMSIAKKEITFQELDNNKIRYDLSSKAKLNSFRFLFLIGLEYLLNLQL